MFGILGRPVLLLAWGRVELNGMWSPGALVGVVLDGEGSLRLPEDIDTIHQTLIIERHDTFLHCISDSHILSHCLKINHIASIIAEALNTFGCLLLLFVLCPMLISAAKRND